MSMMVFTLDLKVDAADTCDKIQQNSIALIGSIQISNTLLF